MVKVLRMPGAQGVLNHPGYAPKDNYKYITAIRHRTAAKPGEVRNPWGSRGKPASEYPEPTEQWKRHMEARKLTELCRKDAEEVYGEVKKILMSDTSADTAKLTAAQMILDRAYGKATQTQVNAQVNADGKTSEIDDSELTRRINDAVKRVEDVTKGTGEAVASAERPADLRKLN